VIDYAKPVKVFKNLKYGCYTIMQGGLPRASARQVRLQDAAFTVRESGRQRMLREQRRTIHAFITGTLVDFVHAGDNERSMAQLPGTQVHYNPQRGGAFMDLTTDTPVDRAAMVQLDEQGVSYN